MSTPPAAGTGGIRDADDLCEVLGTPFSLQQLTAITAPLEPGVIIAGAGSGKTTVMAARVVWLVGTGQVRPEEVLGLTFTRKAAAELSQRIRNALDQARVVDVRGIDESGEQVVMTYDAFAGRLVAEHGLRLGYEADPTMISGATRYRLASRAVRNAAGPFEFISRLRPGTVTERVLKLDSDLQQHLVETRQLDPHARRHLIALQSAPTGPRGPYVDIRRAALAAQERLELASLVEDYQQLKQRLGVVEFADQMAIAAQLAREVPAVSALLRGTFRVVLLDEFQDTSAAQARLLRELFSGPTPTSGRGHAVTAVGDPFQAIYGWRGAAPSNITSFDHDFPRADGRPARTFALTVNRRSGQQILDLANTLSRPLREERQVGAGGGHRDAAAVSPGGVAAGDPDGLGLLQAPPEALPAIVRAATFESWPQEISWIADQVLAVAGPVGGPARVPWAEVAVLTRRNADIGPLYAELTGRDVPVEIVGLGGLLHLPEISDVTATLRLVDDVAANPDLVRLLTGPRWRVGPRDLALLGRRAVDLATGHRAGHDLGRPAPTLAEALGEAVADVDPTDVVCLLDALDDPGDAGYSPQARERFAALAAELADLRRHGDEPVLDLTRRVIHQLGLDIEVMATPELARARRRDQLGAFLDAVADYVDVDGDASLTGLLAYLQAEADQGVGLEQAVPSDRQAVKLLTMHKAKGLEWDVVFLPALMHGIFPSDRVTDNWVTSAEALPADLRGDAGSIPQLTTVSNDGLKAYKADLSRQQQLAEDRLAYVAVTRARRLLVGSGHHWRPDLRNPRRPSSYLVDLCAAAEQLGELVAVAPPPGTDNPLVVDAAPRPWPAPLEPEAAARRHAVAADVAAARDRRARSGSYEPAGGPAHDLLLDTAEVVAGWDADLDRLLGEAAAVDQPRVVDLPTTLTATAVLRLQSDPERFAAELARPMPRPPARAARFGTRFHQWVEQYFAGRLPTGGLGQQQLIDPDDLPDRADADRAGGDWLDEDLVGLGEAFARGRYGRSLPYAVEAPFTLLLGGRLVRGRIDAVYEVDGAGGFAWQVVDWKTGVEPADPLQLAIYRLAWAEIMQVRLDEVDAVFHHVRTDSVVRPTRLADRAELELMLADRATP